MVELAPGDLLGFSGNDLVSHVVNLGSLGLPYRGISHVGIVSEWASKLVLFESTTFQSKPCLIKGKIIAGVQANRIEDRLAGRVWLYKLKRPLTLSDRIKLRDFLLTYVGKSYDTLGAFQSGGKLFSLIQKLKFQENLHTIFCSELCAAALREVDRLETESASYWSPNKLLRYLVTNGITEEPVRYENRFSPPALDQSVSY